MQRLMESAARNPDGVMGRLTGRLLGSGNAPNTDVPDTAVRVYIAPTNYAGQGFLWARSLEAADPRVGARNMAITLPGDYAFRADTPVSIAAFNSSEAWGEAEWKAAQRFTHVLVEAERPMFGRRFGHDLRAEVAALEAAGLSVAFICHGNDIRDPDRHAALTPWSLFPEDPRTEFFRSEARKNLALITEFGNPVFVSTPDLSADVPHATWCPVIVDLERFGGQTPPVFSQERVRVVHASSDPFGKGTNYIEPALAPLITSGMIDYRLVTATPAAEMPAVFAAADIVIDQFRAGSYGVAACEAMASGRVVLGHVMPVARDFITQQTGLELPIVEATPDTLRAVVEELAANPDRAREIGEAGRHYVTNVHTGEASARALLRAWIGD
ncbi:MULTISPECIES: glycosyltransferase [unclassified Leucobacter]|uniref:glycosyltransferase n=1 Tax=unclassified Leucobacter TaxID=2621730 RepID=UPI003019FCB9